MFNLYLKLTLLMILIAIVSCAEKTTLNPIEKPQFEETEINLNVNENTAVDIIIHTAVAMGVEITYELSGIDTNDFNINEDNGELTFQESLNHEMPVDENEDNIYEITIIASNEAGSSTQTLTIRVIDIKTVLADTMINLSIPENTATDVVIHTTVATGEEPLTYSLAAGSDMDDFDLDTDSGELTFKTIPNFEAATDANNDNVYEIMIKVDNSIDPSVQQTVIVTVTDVLTAFESANANLSIPENTATSVVIHTAVATGEEPLTYSLSGLDMSDFDLDTDSGELTFKTIPNFEAATDANNDNVYEVIITADNSIDPSVEQTVIVTVTNVLTAFENANTNLSIPENTAIDVVVYTAVATGEGTITYSISGIDTDFDFDTDNGELTFKTIPDFEVPSDANNDNTYEFIITADNSIDPMVEQIVKLTVSNLTEYTRLTGVNNPLNGLSTENIPHITFADLDGDNDSDLIIHEGGLISERKFNYYENIDNTFTKQLNENDPFSNILVNTALKLVPVFIDLDGDDDLDLVAGEQIGFGRIHYFKNDSGVFTTQTGSANPFDDIDLSLVSFPAFFDIDGDNDLDLFVSDANEKIFYFKNDNGVFTEQPDSVNPFINIIFPSGNKHISFTDIDGDNNLDLILRTQSILVGIQYFRNNNDGTFTKPTGIDNPFIGLELTMSGFSTPAFADLDNDGDLDLVIGGSINAGVELLYFRRD